MKDLALMLAWAAVVGAGVAYLVHVLFIEPPIMRW